VEKSWDAEDSIPPGDGLLGLWAPPDVEWTAYSTTGQQLCRRRIQICHW